MREGALRYPAPAEPPSPTQHLLHQSAQVVHILQRLTPLSWD